MKEFKVTVQHIIEVNYIITSPLKNQVTKIAQSTIPNIRIEKLNLRSKAEGVQIIYKDKSFKMLESEKCIKKIVQVK